MKIKTKVVAGVFYKDSRVFVFRKRFGRNRGFFEFPGGKIDEGESSQQALIREIKEELGVACQVQESLGVFQDEHLHIEFFRVQGDLARLTWKDHDALSLVDLNIEFQFPVLGAADLSFLKKFLRK